MLDRAYAVVLAGGKGERFWPLSTSRRPKQLLTVVGEEPLLTAAVRRLEGLIPASRVLIITSSDLVGQIRQLLPQVPPENILGEPMPRDTAAACALGCAWIQARDPEGLMVVLTADHVIGDPPRFRETLHECVVLAGQEPVLVTMGIVPTRPHTGFGYLEIGEPLDWPGSVQFYRVVRFVEKPDAPTAEQFVAGGRHYWNSGMFVWAAATFRRALGEAAPPLEAMVERLTAAVGGADFEETLRKEYLGLAPISVDYAVMERVPNIVVARATFPWDDVGAWPAIASHVPADDHGNVILGDCEAMDATGNIVVSRGRLTALLGVKDLVVVQADGVTLVCSKNRAQDVKHLVRRMREQQRWTDFL